MPPTHLLMHKQTRLSAKRKSIQSFIHYKRPPPAPRPGQQQQRCTNTHTQPSSLTEFLIAQDMVDRRRMRGRRGTTTMSLLCRSENRSSCTFSTTSRAAEARVIFYFHHRILLQHAHTHRVSQPASNVWLSVFPLPPPTRRIKSSTEFRVGVGNGRDPCWLTGWLVDSFVRWASDQFIDFPRAAQS